MSAPRNSYPWAVITRPGYTLGDNQLAFISRHRTLVAARRKAATWAGYMVVPAWMGEEPIWEDFIVSQLSAIHAAIEREEKLAKGGAQ